MSKKDEIVFDDELDVSGKKSPMPLVKSRKAVNKLERGEVLKVITTDIDSVSDLQEWADETKNVELVDNEVLEEDDEKIFHVYLKRVQ
jgi:tRNA 2-thiouridine synthesizing protein A